VLCKHYGNNARQRYGRLFSGPPLGQAYAGLYQSVLGH
jgi:hypothetical protein